MTAMRRALVCVVAATMLIAAAFGARAGPIDADRALAASRAAIGSEPGAYAFTDIDGRRVTLSDYRGKPLVVSFVYTACSQVCPTTTRFLAKAVREARAVVGPDAFRVVSIGFDIPSDNPMSMRLFARQNAIADDRNWAFLTPDAGVPRPLARDFGFAFEPQSGGYEHLTQITILDGRGRIYAQVYGESYSLPMLIQPLRELALGEPAAPSVGTWLGRVRLLCTVYDPASGKYRVDYGLFIEIGVGLSCLGLTAWFLWRERRRARRSC
ncbi:MAG: SCO family protein [Usitatibacter sp.]